VVLLGSGAGSLLALTVANQLANSKLTVRAVIGCGVQPTLEPWDTCSPAKAKLFEQFAGGMRHLLNPMEMDAQRFPPTLLIHGDSDPDVPAKYVTKLHMRLIEAGESSTLAILNGLPHLALEHPHERSGKAALERILPFLAEHAREPESEQLFTGNRQ
jgi:acetyl esterase/lipase